MPEFIDFTVTIEKYNERLLVRGFSPGRGETSPVEVELTLNEEEVENIRNTVERDGGQVAKTDWGTRAYKTTKSDELKSKELLKNKGKELFDCIFVGEVRNAFKLVWAEIQSLTVATKLRLRIRSDASLGSYPFEIMYCDDGDTAVNHFGLNPGIALVRSQRGVFQVSKEKRERIKPPLRILIVVADPDNDLLSEDEIRNLRQEIELPGLIDVNVLEGKDTLRKLMRKLDEGSYHVLHFIGHGTDKGKLICENAAGGAYEVDGEDFVTRVQGRNTLRLVTLNSCLGGSVGSSLSSVRIPAVVAMQYEITNRAAVAFSTEFYRELALGRPVDTAMTNARIAIQSGYSSSHSPEWATPVLYLRESNGDVLGLKVAPAQLIQFALDQLREGHWVAADRMAGIALEQANQNDDVHSGAAIQQVANACDSFTSAIGSLHSEGELGDSPFFQDAYDELIACVDEFNIHQVKETLGDQLGVCEELLTAIEILSALNSNDFNSAATLCEQQTDSDIVDYPFLKSLVTRIRDTQKDRLVVDGHWDNGDWESAHRAIQKMDREQIARAGLERRQQELERLLAADRSIKTADLATAKQLLRDFGEEGPPNLPLVTGAVSAAEAAIAAATAGDIAKFESERLEFEGLSNSLAQRFPNSSILSSVAKQLSEAAETINFQVARAKYEEGDFAEALELTSHLSSPQCDRLRQCSEHWLAVREAFDNGEWDTALIRLREVRSLSVSEKDQRQVRLWRGWAGRAPRVLAILDHMASQPLICDRRVPWQGGNSPYQHFTKWGLSPSSTLKECDAVSFEVQAHSDKMSRDQREAWDALRLPEKRLLVDFSLYKVADADNAQSIANRLRNAPLINDQRVMPQNVIAELGEDAGIYLALCGDYTDYQGAVDVLLEQARAQPHNRKLLHHLGLASAGALSSLEEAGKEDAQADACRSLVVGWGAIFADQEGFWHQWWAERRKVYATSVSNLQVLEARLQLQSFWVQQLAAYTDVSPGISRLFQAEINAAAAVHSGGGIPVDGDRVVVGFAGARELGLVDAVQDWIRGEIQPEDLKQDGWKRRLCLYFSELGEAAVLFDDNRHEDVVAMLCKEAWEPVLDVANLGYLAFPDPRAELDSARSALIVQSSMKLALKKLAEKSGQIEDVIAHWERAVELAAKGEERESVLTEIQDKAVGRAHALAQKVEQRTESLNDAVRLLQEVFERKWDNDQHIVRATLVNVMLNQAVHFSNEYDNEKAAREIAREAVKLVPEDLRAIDIYAMSCIHYSKDFVLSGQPERSEALLAEAEGYLDHGETLYPGNRELARTRDILRQAREMASANALDDLEEMLNKRLPDEVAGDKECEDVSRDLLVEAMFCEAQSKYPEAIAAYGKLLEIKPDDPGIAQKMAICYRIWIIDATRAGGQSQEGVRSILQEAVERFPDSPHLQDIANAMDPTRETKDR